MKKELKPYTLDTENFTKVYHGDPIIEVFSENGHSISIEKRGSLTALLLRGLGRLPLTVIES